MPCRTVRCRRLGCGGFVAADGGVPGDPEGAGQEIAGVARLPVRAQGGVPVQLAVPVYEKAGSGRAWAKRIIHLDQHADVRDVLTDVDQRIAELQQRVDDLLADETA